MNLRCIFISAPVVGFERLFICRKVCVGYLPPELNHQLVGGVTHHGERRSGLNNNEDEVLDIKSAGSEPVEVPRSLHIVSIVIRRLRELVFGSTPSCLEVDNGLDVLPEIIRSALALDAVTLPEVRELSSTALQELSCYRVSLDCRSYFSGVIIESLVDNRQALSLFEKLTPLLLAFTRSQSPQVRERAYELLSRAGEPESAHGGHPSRQCSEQATSL